MRDLKPLFAHQSDEWETPQPIFDGLNSEFHFTLDPCATAENHKCETFFTIKQNGLLQNWGGKQCSVIHRILKLERGLKKHFVRVGRTIPPLCFSFHPELTQNTFIILFTRGQRYDSCEVGLNLETVKNLLRSRQWWLFSEERMYNRRTIDD